MTEKIPSLSQNLTTVQVELEKIIESLTESLGYVEKRKEEIAEDIASRDGDLEKIDPETKQMLIKQNVQFITTAIGTIYTSLEVIRRFNKVTIDGIDIAKSVEKSWVDSLKDYLQKTKWYREMYPYILDRQRLEKDYNKNRRYPKQFDFNESYKKRRDLIEKARENRYSDPQSVEETRKELDKLTQTELEASTQKNFKLKRVAQTPLFDSIVKSLSEATSLIYNLILNHFVLDGDNAILKSTNVLISKIKSERGKKVIKPTMHQALGEELRILESTFGSEGYPGIYLTTGRKSFLIYALSQLKGVIEQLNTPIEERQVAPRTSKELSEDDAAQQKERARLEKTKPLKYKFVEPPAIKGKANEEIAEEEKGSSDKSARLQIIIERRNIIANRKRRLHIVQRIASLKEEFFNG